MKLSPTFTTVTPLSKFLALFFFMLFNVLGFYLGRFYQQSEAIRYTLRSQKAEIIEKTQTTPDDMSNWKMYSFEKIGFSFKLPSDWTLLSDTDSHTAIVESKVINDSDPYGQYYMTKVISGPKFYAGPKAVLDEYQLPKDWQQLANSTDIINGNFGYNGFLNEAGFLNGEADSLGRKYTKINIDGKEAILAEASYLSEVFIPLQKLEGMEIEYALVLSIENDKNIGMLKKILSTFRFLDEGEVQGAQS